MTDVTADSVFVWIW